MKSFSFDEPDYFRHAIPNFKKHLLPHLKSIEGWKHILEIGTMEGRMPIWVFKNVDDITHIQSIENKVIENLSKNYSKIIDMYENRWEINYIDSTSCELYFYLAYGYDFVYIDGGHSSMNVLSDAVNGFKCLNNGGIMAFDDYEWPKTAPDGTSPKVAIDAFLECYKNNIEVIEKNYQVWIRKIK
jgi:predicted O-methyltransferase YrrM